MRVAVLGAGAIGLGNAALLCQRGHEPIVWSPSGSGIAANKNLVAFGVLEGEFAVGVATTCEEAVANAEVVLLAIPANGHKGVLDRIAPCLLQGQVVLVSGHLSFSALYLSKLLAKRGLSIPIGAWGTTVTTGRRKGQGRVNVRNVRAKVDVAAVPVSEIDRVVAACVDLFGDRFAAQSDLMAVMLSNLNPQNHAGIALCNLTRIERGEEWAQNENTTDAVGRLLEGLDAERLQIADAFGLQVRTIREHYHFSFKAPMGPVGEMARLLHERGNGGLGPTSLDTRYVLEDAPFGLYPSTLLGRLVNRSANLHESAIAILSALYGRDFAAENDLLPHLGLSELSPAALHDLARAGYRGAV